MKNFRPQTFREAEKSYTSPNIIKQLILFIIFFFASQIIEAVIMSFYTTPLVKEMLASLPPEEAASLTFKKSYKLTEGIVSKPEVMLMTLFLTVIATALAFFVCLCIERRKSASMGFRKRKMLPHYLTGLLTGGVMMSAVVGAMKLFGIAEIKTVPNADPGLIALFFLGYILQGMSEEVIFRGYLMNSIGSRTKTWIAVLISSVAFAAAHLGNPGVTPLAFINLVLFAVFAASYFILFDDIWGVCAIHSIWNFTQGNVYGISVSGTGKLESLLRTTAVSDSAWLTGGKFGIEGSIFTTFIFLIGEAVVVTLIIKKYRTE